MGSEKDKLLHERELLALGGLLHDIGKLVERALSEGKRSEWENWSCTEEDKTQFGYSHACVGYKFYEDKLKEVLKKGLKEEDLPLIESAFYHHNPKGFKGEPPEAAWVHRFADFFVSGERLSTDDIREESYHRLQKRLRPVFELLAIGRKVNPSEVGKYFYPLEVLELTEDSSAGDWEKILFPREEKDNGTETDKGNYKELLNRFIKEGIEKIKKNRYAGDISGLLSVVYHLLYKYLWAVPSSTVEFKEGKPETRHYPDVSLFDHSRLVAAVAAALWTDYNREHIKGFKEDRAISIKEKAKELKLLLVEGDLSGIQRFLFGISNIKGASKRLRGRSFFLAVLPELVARYILHKLGYPPTNILYAGGGKFELLIGYEKDIEERLEELEKEIDSLLVENFGGQLGLVLGWQAFPLSALADETGKEGEELTGYAKVVKDLHTTLNAKKKHKFAAVLPEIERKLNEQYRDALQKNKSGVVLCRSCKSAYVPETGNEEEEICEWCKKFADLGGKLPKKGAVAFFVKNPQYAEYSLFEEKNGKEIKHLGFKLVESQHLTRQPDADDVLLINSTHFEQIATGFRFIGTAVPLLDKETYELLKKNLSKSEELVRVFEEEEENSQEGSQTAVAPFEVIAYFARGSKKLAYLKMDVDNLGLLFMVGLQSIRLENGKSLSAYTFSRIATLSRLLDLFFSGYLNALFKKRIYRPTGELREAVETSIYTVYAGGDDLFLIAPWDKGVKVACAIRGKFGKYTCNNPDVGLSGGVALFNYNYPIYFAAKKTDSAEDLAKKTDLQEVMEELEFLYRCKGKEINRKVKEQICKEAIERLNQELKDLKKWETPPYLYKKDKVALFRRALKWKPLGEVLRNDIPLLLWCLKKNKVSRRMLYLLYSYLKGLIELKNSKKCKEFEKRYLRFFPIFYYLVGRNVTDEKCREVLEKVFIDRTKDYELRLDEAYVALSYVLLATRNQ